jgi:hypothetical protein
MNQYTDDWGAGRPAWLGPQEEFRTPAQEWQSFMATQAPFWETRAPLQDVGARLRARYLLAAPEMAQVQGTPVSFSEYLRGYQQMQQGADPGYFATQPTGETTSLRGRATEAAKAAGMDPGAYVATYQQGTPGFDRAAWLAEQFNPVANAQRAQQNQLAVANMLALQRRGGGQTTGMMASAIRNAMARLQQQRANVGAPSGSFLDWYLGQTA